MQMGEYCRACLLEKRFAAAPRSATPEQISRYQNQLVSELGAVDERSSPEVTVRASEIYRSIFGPERDYSSVKRHFNALMLALEPSLQADIDRADDPLARAVQYAMTGNFIDSAVLGDVNEQQLRELLDKAAQIHIDPAALQALRRETLAARTLVYFTDNCGEILADKLLIRALRAINPALEVTVIVRGMPVVNDATLEDAEQVGMREVAQRVIGNGCDLPGIVLHRISEESRMAAESADMLISKGQANFEGLSGCGLNLFYIFMCKCQLFMNMFNVPQFSGILTMESAITPESIRAALALRP